MSDFSSVRFTAACLKCNILPAVRERFYCFAYLNIERVYPAVGVLMMWMAFVVLLLIFLTNVMKKQRAKEARDSLLSDDRSTIIS